MKNIEKINKFCSELNKIFDYPYFFNWSFPTNYIDHSDDGFIEDSTYFILRVGKYYKPEDKIINGVPYEMRSNMVEIQLFFGSCDMITKFVPFNILFDDGLDVRHINSFDDIIKNKEYIETKLNELLNKNI